MKPAFIVGATLVIVFVLWYWYEELIAAVYEIPASWLIAGMWILFVAGYVFAGREK